MTDYIIQTYKGKTEIRGARDYQRNKTIQSVRSTARMWYRLDTARYSDSPDVWTVVLKVNKNTRIAEPYGYVNEYLGPKGERKIGWWNPATGMMHDLKYDGTIGPARANPYKKKITSKSKYRPSPFGL